MTIETEVIKLPSFIKGYQRYRMKHDYEDEYIEFSISNEDLLLTHTNVYDV